MSKITQSAKKKVHLENIFLHLSADFGLKIQNNHCYRNFWTFLTSQKLALNGSPNGPADTQKAEIVKESTLGYTYGLILDAIPQ